MLFDSASDLQGIGRVNAKEDPEDFGWLAPGLDSLEPISVFLIAKASFESRGPLSSNLLCQDFTVVFKLASPSLSLEIRLDMLTGAPTPVAIGCIDSICSDAVHLSKQLGGFAHRGC